MTSIVFHRSDPDGWFANSVCRKFLSKDREPLLSVGWDYGDAAPELPPEGDIYMVDIAVNELLENPDLRRRLVWIDHHATSIQQWDGPLLSGEEIRGIRCAGVAACRLCWWWFRMKAIDPAKTMRESIPLRPKLADWSVRQSGEPEALFLVGLRDVRDHENHFLYVRCNHLNLALVARRDDEALRERLIGAEHLTDTRDRDLDRLLVEGAAIARYAESLNREHAERGAMVRVWKDLRWLILNTQAKGSQVLESYAKAHDDGARPYGISVDALMVWAVSRDDRINVSFYHAPGRKDLDLSVFAKEFGGGGHPGACGCQVPWTWIHWLIYDSHWQ
jgi:hypothetical protein